MKQINPLYVAMLLLVLLVLVVVQLNKAKNEQYEAKENLKQTKEMAERIVALKKSWSDASQSNKNLQKLLRAPQLKASQIEQKKEGDKVILSSKNMDIAAVNYMVNKLLNGTFVLGAVKIVREENELFSFSVEVRL